MGSYYYFDHAATTPLDASVLAAMQPYLTSEFYNPSAYYAPAKAVRHAVETARHQVAQLLGAKTTEIIFTGSGTEANALAIQGVMRQYPDAHCVVSAIEHESVLASAAFGQVSLCPVDAQAVIDLQALRALITDQTVLISIMYANNEVGIIQPLREVVKLVQSIRQDRRQRGIDRPLYVHTDACQAANYLDLHVSRLGVDLMTLNGSKVYGPKGTGCLYVRTGTQLTAIIPGGGQENGLRSGTENVAGIIGFAAALAMAVELRDAEAHRLALLRDSVMSQLQSQRPDWIINGHIKQRLANNVHVTVPGADAETMIVQLESAGMLCAAGSACSASSQEPSHVLRAMGIADADARASLRITFGRSTDKSAIDALVAALVHITA